VEGLKFRVGSYSILFKVNNNVLNIWILWGGGLIDVNQQLKTFFILTNYSNVLLLITHIRRHNSF